MLGPLLLFEPVASSSLSLVVDGDFGLLSRDGVSSFDAARMRTDDMAYFDLGSGENLMAAWAAFAPWEAPLG